jgi:ERCC4-type nuclease
MVDSPFVVLVDSAEQLPYQFLGLRTDADQGSLPLRVQTRTENLSWGDYSIEGYARMVTVERKSPADLAGTLTGGRKRFEREMDGLREYDAAWVVVEAELSELFKGFAWAPKFRPRTITRSAMYWQIRYPRVHWWAVPGRAAAEALTYQLLRAWWRERIDGPIKESAKKMRLAKRLAASGG